MNTSGTVAQTQISVDTLISHALGRCGQLPSAVGGELLDRIREALYFIVADMGNDGINLWCMTKSVVNVIPYNSSYQLPTGTNDITDALYRTLWDVQGILYQSSLDRLIFQATQPNQLIDNVTGSFGAAGTASLAIEYSNDGFSWTTLTTMQSIEVIAGAVFTLDLDNSALARFWSIRDTSGTLISMNNVMFRKVNTEITMAKLNKDDYTNLPNKHYAGGKGLQFWFDKQIEPRIWVWPMSNQAKDQFVFWAASQVQDPGDLQNELAIPSRWYRSLVATLSHQAAFLIPANQLPPGRLADLKNDADESRIRALDGESDGSSYQLAPRIGGYTK